MELKLSKRIKKYRTELGITQGELAERLGVTHQSVSKWENDDGYPDITLLPALANQFGITIDTLMGNDDLGRKEELEQYEERFDELWEKPKEQIALATQMYRKYPEEWMRTVHLLIRAITEHPGHIDLPLLREVTEHVMDKCTIPYIREFTLERICTFCEDDEFEKWLSNIPSGYAQILSPDEMRERRYWERGKHEECHAIASYNNLMRFCGFLMRNARYSGYPEKSVERNLARLRLIDLYCEEGKFNAWSLYKDFTMLRLSAALFGCGRNEEGYEVLDKAIALHERCAKIPAGTLLTFGDDSFFGGIYYKVGDEDDTWRIYFADGTWAYNQEGWIFRSGNLYDLLTRPHGWEWFDGVRGEERFQAVVERAKAIG